MFTPITGSQLALNARQRPEISVTYRVALAGVTALITMIALLMAVVDWRHNDFAHMSVSRGYLLGIAAFVLFSTMLKIHLRVWRGSARSTTLSTSCTAYRST